ncbi:unnamed protein product [Mytilus coruscus]|uniref:Endonuclease/exonuclease/phosphatase domain-containing protein n=1 Tax=Mytilus coruscus TaxID=42192 RepID=A0A6J8AI47_MYTCO|nr:unnamed protein product [Mytilus coruscus]
MTNGSAESKIYSPDPVDLHKSVLSLWVCRFYLSISSCGSTRNTNYDNNKMANNVQLAHIIPIAVMLLVAIGYILCLTVAPRIAHHDQLTSSEFKHTFYLNIKSWNSLTPSLSLCMQKIKITYLNKYAKPTKVFLLLTLILANDIHANPGPIRNPCGICKKPVAINHRSIKCDECNFWVHIKCGDTSGQIEDDLVQQNSFSELQNISKSEITSQTETSLESLDINDPPTRQRFNIRIMTVNCRSLRSQQKRNAFTTLIDTHEPHIIHATETHLDKTISNAELINTNIYEVYRKDRVFEVGHEGGGVLNLVRKDLLSTAEITLDTDCEICWNKIEIKGSKPLYTGCYYRPPNNNIASIESLNTSLTRLTHSNNLPNLVLTGDFNMPHIKWEIDEDNNFGSKKTKQL